MALFKNTFFLLLVLLYFTFFSGTKSLAYSGEKPLLVEISTDWCFACKLLKPTIKSLENKYGSNVEFIRLDATNEETKKLAENIAANHDILNFFHEKGNAFPTVGIFSKSGQIEKIILGAHDKSEYELTLNKLLGDVTIAEDEKSNEPPYEPQEEEIASGRPGEPVLTERPEEPALSERPDIPNLLDRPNEAIASGRPKELSFWEVGAQIPLYAYFQFLVLPKCSDGVVICSDGKETKKPVEASNENVFKPWTPNPTRNEKGFNSVKVVKR